jgi:glucosamine 6-phosphate synthetase-like amidotransferase/phosphosugar isomerase protein
LCEERARPRIFENPPRCDQTLKTISHVAIRRFIEAVRRSAGFTTALVSNDVDQPSNLAKSVTVE